VIELNIDGIDVIAKEGKLIGEPYQRNGEWFQDAEITMLEPLKYFFVDLSPKTCPVCGATADPYSNLPCWCSKQIDDGHDGSEL